LSGFFKKSLVGIFACVTFAGFMGCESQADKDRKPEVVEKIMDDMVERCEKNNAQDIDTAYSNEELRDALMLTDTKDLELFQKKGITIFADSRFMEQDCGFFSTRIEGIYYINSKLLALNPRNDDSRNSQAIEKLADLIRENKIPPGTKIMYAGKYGGKVKRMDWDSPEDFNKSAQENNPRLLVPHIKGPSWGDTKGM